MSATKTAEGTKFEIHVTGDTTGKLWAGSFRCKRTLSFRDKLNADALRRELLGGAPGSVDTEAAAFAFALSQLSVRLTEMPEWWTAAKGGLDLEDSNILEEVYKKAKDIEREYLKSIETAGQVAQNALREEKK